MPTQTEQNLDKLLSRIDSLARDFFENSETEAQQEAVVKSLNSAYLSFSSQAREATGGDCPAGWKECANGSCVAPGDDCNGIG